MPAATTSRARKPTTRKPTLDSRALSRLASDTDKLAAQVATTLSLGDDTKSKGKQKALSVEEKKLDAMRMINDASQKLSGVMQSGWKESSEKGKKARSEPAAIAYEASAAAARHLDFLRSLSTGDLNVERAAMTILGKLVALDMYDTALAALRYAHPRLCTLVGGTAKHLLSIPLSPIPDEHAPVLSTLISTYFLNGIIILTQTRHSTFFGDLLDPPTLLDWVPHLSSTGLSDKHMDSMLTKAYSVLMKVSVVGISSKNLFEIRMYALRCLAHTTPGTVQKPDSIWDQACKVAAAFIKTHNETSISEAAQTITGQLMALVTVCGKRVDYEEFVSGKGFATFCESWIGFASKANNVQALEKIATMMGQSPPSPSPNLPLPFNSDKDLLRQGTRMCAAFAQLLALLNQGEQGGDDDVLARIRDIRDVLDCSKESAPKILVLSCHDGMVKEEGHDKDLIRVAGKADRAFGRLRRASLDALEKRETSKQVKGGLAEMLRIMVDVYEKVIQITNPRCHLDHYTQVLDTLFTLSRACVDVSDPRTYGNAYDLLERAVKILSLSINDNGLPSPEHTPTGHSDFIRCTSGAFYNIGGTIYQAGRYSSAIPFLKEACRLGEVALLVYEQQRGEDRTEKDVKHSPWIQLKDQLWRRFQLLAVCYIKIGDRRPSFASFIQSVQAFPSHVFESHIDRVGLRKLLDVSSGVKELRCVVEKLTHLGACELMLHASDVSLSARLCGNLDASVLGALMEWQIQSLEGSRLKEGIRDVLVGLLEQTLSIYREGQMPVRSLRVLATTLEFAYHVRLDSSAQPVHQWLSTQSIKEEADRLYNLKDLGQDVHLAHYRCEYQGSIYLWLALHTHRHSDANQVKLAASHAEAGCTMLRSLLGVSKSLPKPSLPPQHPIARSTKSVSRKLPKSTAPTVSRIKGKPPIKGRSTKAPATPKLQDRMSMEDIPLNSFPSLTTNDPRSLIVDSMEKLLDLLQLSSYVLGILSLTLPKVSTLDLLRELSERHLGENSDCYISSSSELALEYLKLGKYKRATKVLNQTLPAARSTHASDEARALFFLSFAASCVANDDLEQSVKLYQEGWVLIGLPEPQNKQAPTIERIHTRVSRIGKSALAYEVFSLIQSRLNNISGSLDGLLQALRLWNRGFESLGRLQPPTSKSQSAGTVEHNPFETTSLKDALPTLTPSTPQSVVSLTEPSSRGPGPFTQRRILSTGLEWRIGEGLLNTLFLLSRVYLERGSPREAQYFAEQAKDLAEALNAPAGMCMALMKNGEVKLCQGLLAEGSDQLEEIEKWVNTCADGYLHSNLADLYRLQGDLEQRGSMLADAQKHYRDAIAVIERVDRDFDSLDGVEFGPRVSLGNSLSDTLFPELMSQLLCRYAWALRTEQTEASPELLERLDCLSLTSTIKSHKKGLLARLALHDVHRCSRIDMFLSSIGETTVALSTSSNNLAVSLSPASIDLIKSLEHAEKLFWAYLSSLGGNGYVPDIREAAVSIAIIQAFQASLGRSDSKSPLITAGLLDASSSLTLRNEMLEAITNKFPATPPQDGLGWPRLSDPGIPQPQYPNLSNDPDDGLASEEISLKEYWDNVKQRYQSFAINPETLTSSMISELPQHWSVVHISVTEDKNTMFISRQRGGSQDQPLIFCVPLKGRREDADDEHLTFEDALTEMNEIVSLSNETTKVAASIRHDQAARSKWWKERGALDTRLRDLLENIEFCWLGAFKTILSKDPHLSPDAIKNLRLQFDRVFQCGLRLQDRKTKERALGHNRMPSEVWAAPNRVTLDDALVECFSALAPDCRDEELEDLVYFMLDLYQFHGVPVAIAEVDIDQVVVDLRSVLEEHAAKSKNVGHGLTGAFGYSDRDVSNEHLFLVLDKNVQGLPWENIPVLRGRSVSRIPSISFLLDRVQFAQLQRVGHDRTLHPIDGAALNPRSVYYIINPSGDLERTEERFHSWLTDMEKVGWQGISGRAPSELQVLNALQTKDLVIYFGHGGAEQYVRSHKLKSLPRCSAVMLWGCSSGALRDMGDFDRVGTPLNYMLAGCPTLIANLWDVTDKDIDTFSQSVFDKLGMFSESVQNWPLKSGGRTPVSVVQAVAESRNSCKLKYLTGAAPVVYGIPFYL